MSYTNPNCVPCTAEQIVLTPCTTGCPIILSEACVIHKGAAISCLGIEVDETWDTILPKLTDAICAAESYLFDITCLGGSATANIGVTVNALIDYICDTVISFPTFNTSCLDGGNPTESLSDTIDRLIAAVCEDPAALTFGSLDWACLTPSASPDLDDVLQGLINNIKANGLSFGAGFSVTPLTCGSLVEYTGAGSSGIALSVGTGTVATGLGIGSFIDVTPASGINTSYNIATRHVNEVPAVITNYAANVSSVNATVRLRWDKYVEFDGSLTLAEAFFDGLDYCYNAINIPLVTGLPVKYRPTHASGAKVFPCHVHINDAGVNLPGCPDTKACSYMANIVVMNTGTINLQIVDCRFAVDYETLDFDSGIIWLSNVQYYAV